jgi:hypothetical protein
MKLPALRYTSSTGARLTFRPALRRLAAATRPALRAADAGWTERPICFSDLAGPPGSRRTTPPSWSVISSSGSRTGSLLLIAACCSSAATLLSCAWLEMLPPKKMTPATWPARIFARSPAGGVRPE